MLRALLPYILPTSSAFVAWLFSFLYYKKERKNDLTNRLMKQIDELTVKYVELSDKYIVLHGKMCKLQKENIQLKEDIAVLIPKIESIKGRLQ